MKEWLKIELISSHTHTFGCNGHWEWTVWSCYLSRLYQEILAQYHCQFQRHDNIMLKFNFHGQILPKLLGKYCPYFWVNYAHKMVKKCPIKFIGHILPINFGHFLPLGNYCPCWVLFTGPSFTKLGGQILPIRWASWNKYTKFNMILLLLGSDVRVISDSYWKSQLSKYTICGVPHQ